MKDKALQTKYFKFRIKWQTFLMIDHVEKLIISAAYAELTKNAGILLR